MNHLQAILTRGYTPLKTLILLAFVGLPAIAMAESHATADDEIQARFEEALDALNAEKVYTARRLLKSLLADYPTLHRARLELARADYLARDYDAAEAEIQQVLDDPDVPPSVRTTLLAFQAQIRDDRSTFEQRHGWTGQIYAGLMYDSNVNFGVGRDIVDINGQLFTVNPQSQETSDGAGVVDAGLLHTYNPNRTFRSGEDTGFFIWQTQGNAYYRGYFDETDFNLGVLTLRTGPAWVVPENWRFSLGLQGDQIWLGGDDLAFFTSLNPAFSKQLSDRTDITFAAAVTDRNYKRDFDQGRDGTQWRGGVTLTHLYPNGVWGTQAGIAYTNFDADDDRFGYKGPDVFAGVNWKAWERGSVYGRVGYRRFEYDAPEPLFTEARDDDEWRLTAGFRHELASVLPGWIVRGEWIWSDNSSNNPLFDYDRHQVSLGLQKNF